MSLNRFFVSEGIPTWYNYVSDGQRTGSQSLLRQRGDSKAQVPSVRFQVPA